MFTLLLKFSVTGFVLKKLGFVFFLDLEQRFYRSEPDCIAAGKPLPEFDLYISTVLPLENKGIR